MLLAKTFQPSTSQLVFQKVSMPPAGVVTSQRPFQSATKTQEATEELAYLMTFNQSITQAMARTETLCLLTWVTSGPA